MTARDYADILDAVTHDQRGAMLEQVLDRYVQWLVSQGGQRQLDRIITSYQEKYNHRHGIVPILLTTAQPLGPTLTHQVVTAIERVTGRKAEVTEVHDPTVGAGAIIAYDDTVVNASVSGSITQLRGALSA